MSTLRAIQAAERRRQREAQRQLRDLERQAKEQAKLSALDQARSEVETYENRISLLRSVHKEHGEAWDWNAIVASLLPPCPSKSSFHEQRANQTTTVFPSEKMEEKQSLIDNARKQDEQDFQTSLSGYTAQKAEWEKLTALGRRILEGDHKAYTTVLAEFNPFAEISDLGSSIHFTVHDSRLIECLVKVNGKQIIPAEVKTLTASGKVSVKQMSKGLFHSIYLEYLCGCALRVAREVFALLPVDTVLVTAMADWLDPRTGLVIEQPVLSVAMPRSQIASLVFDRLDPSVAMENFICRGDFKASRNREAFEPIDPITLADLPQPSTQELSLERLRVACQRLREDAKSRINSLNPSLATPLQPEQPL